MLIGSLLSLEKSLAAPNVVEMAVLVHHQINLGGRQALNACPGLWATALVIQFFEFSNMKEVLNDLPQILSDSRPVVGIQLLRELNVEAENLDGNISSCAVLEDHSRMRHFLDYRS